MGGMNIIFVHPRTSFAVRASRKVREANNLLPFGAPRFAHKGFAYSAIARCVFFFEQKRCVVRKIISLTLVIFT